MKPTEDRDTIVTRYLTGPALLERTLAGLRREQLDAAPAAGGWTIRQIVHHIVDGEDIWKICLKAALGNPQGVFTLDWYFPVPQDDWVEHWAYADRALDTSLALLKANRAHVRQLLEKAPEPWERSIGFRKFDGQIEEVTVGAIVEMHAHHLEHHVQRIEAIRQELGGGETGSQPEADRT